MTKFNIEIVSDTVCPWCYVGKKKLEKAIEAWNQKTPGDTFSITWKPFYLNPDSPKIGVDKMKMYQTKFGVERTALIFERLAQTGASLGINFKFGGKTGNTRNSHRLVQLGKTKSPAIQTRVVEELFAAYFESELDITDMAVLNAAGVRAGLEEREVAEWLNSDNGGKEVDEEVRRAKMQFISGVPTFTVQGKYEIGGAQDPEVFLKVFEDIKAEDKTEDKMEDKTEA